MIEAMFISLLGPTLAGALMLCILAGAFTCFWVWLVKDVMLK